MLNFKNFMKVAEDDKTVTMRHDKGHEMRILLKALRPIEREQIKRLKMADGGEVPEEDSRPSETPGASAIDPAKPITINVGAPAAAAPAPAPSAPLAQPVEVPAAPAPNLNPAPSVVPSANTANVENAAATQARALQLRQQAGNEQQAVDTARAKGTLPIAQQQQQNALAEAKRVDNSIKDLQGKAGDMANYLTDPKNFNPNRFYENMAVPQKIATSLGLIFGGFSQGLVGGSNPAAEWLSAQQDKDVAAQKQMADNHRTVWGAYRDLYGDEKIATEMAKKAWQDKLAADANVLAAKLGTPQAAIINKGIQADALQKGYENLQKAAFIANQPKDAASAQNPQGGPGASIEPSGRKQEGKYGPEHANGSGIYNIQPILKPGAAAIMDQEARKATGDPAAAAQLARLQEQYAHASKADEVIGRAKELFSALHENATPGGWVGRTAQHANLEGVPIAGPILQGASGFAGDLFTGARKALGVKGAEDEFSQNRQYETTRQELGDMLRSIYPGIGGGEFNSKLNGIVPDQTDTPADVTKKMKAFEDLIKTSGAFNVIKNKGLAN